MGKSPAPTSPDTTLLAVCAQLRAQQAEWQRLWTLTSDGPEDTTPADRAWTAYNREVWPGINHAEGEGLPGRLLELHPVTAGGLAAKAAAICAMEDVATWGD